MTASECDWTLRVFDHVQLNASDYTASVRFYETVLSPLGIPKIAEHEQGTWSSAWTDFTNLNVWDRRPPTTNLHLCFYARSKERLTELSSVRYGSLSPRPGRTRGIFR
jgi:catechol 2,3-dioxygenase-like lactoylglutathione lyase family enzyme